MKRKKYFHFAIGRVIAGLIIGAVIFSVTAATFSNIYNDSVDSGYINRQDTYKKLIESYANGRYDDTFLEIITNIYATDYIKFAKINDDGSIESVFETDYEVIPVEDSLHHWYDITNDETLLEQGKKSITLNDSDWVIEYKKCDEVWQLGEIVDTRYTNSWDLCAVDYGYGGYYSNPLFYFATELSGFLAYDQPVIKSHYVDGDTLHIGKVSQVGYEPFFSRPFAKKWDFTDSSKADLYVTVDEEGFAEELSVFRKADRPDAYLNDLEKIFLAKNLGDLTSEFDNRFGDDYDWDYDLDYTDYYAYGGPDNTHDDEYKYSITTHHEGGITRGIINVYKINGQQYMVEFVMTTLLFEDFYEPFLILFAIVLFILCVGIALLTAIRPYSQYKKAYENNTFKNNLIDSLAHNMKTPLQILGGYAENLKDVQGGEEKDRYADQILEKTNEMNKDIEAILKTAEKSDMKLVKSSVRSCFDDAAKRAGAKIDITGDRELRMDKDYFCQALYCLVDNANRYKSEGSGIDVKIGKKEIVIRNKTDAGKFTSGTGLALAGRILEQHRLKLNTKLENGVFEAAITKK